MIAGAAAIAILLATAIPAVGLDRASGSRDPEAVLAAALEAATERGAVHYVKVSTEPQGKPSEEVGDITVREGLQQLVTPGLSNVSLINVGSAVYYKGSTRALEADVGLPVALAKASADKWIAVYRNNVAYNAFAAETTLPTVFMVTVPGGTLDVTETRYGGRPVIAVKGVLPDSFGRHDPGTDTMYLSPTAPHLPVAAVLKFGKRGAAAENTWVFTRWGERVEVSAPAVSYPAGGVTPPNASPTTAPTIV